MVINKFIKDVIEEESVDLKYLSSLTGYSVRKLKGIINCRHSVTLEEATVILRVLGIDIWDVLTLGN